MASSVSDVAQSIAEKVFAITENKNLIFIPTAAEVETGSLSWLKADRQALVDAGFAVSDFTFTNKSTDEIKKAFSDAGSICVAGGNNYYLQEQALKSGFDPLIHELVNKGLIYIGSSAGSVVAGPNIETLLDDRSITPNLTNYTGIGLTDVAVRPHWTSQTFKSRYELEIPYLYTVNQKTVLLNDSQYFWVQGEWYQIVSV